MAAQFSPTAELMADRDPAHRDRSAVGNQRPRVLYPFARHEQGGSTVSGARLVRGLTSATAVDALVVAHSRGPAWQHLVDEGLDVEVLGDKESGVGLSFVTYEPRLRMLSKLTRLYWVARDWLARNDVDIIHANDDMSALAWGLAAKRYSVPVIWHVRQPRGHRALDRLLLQLASYVITVADANRRRFDFAGQSTRIVTVHNGLDPARYAARSIVDPLNVDRDVPFMDDLPVVGFVGNLVDRKRPEFALDVSLKLHEAGVDHHLVMAGADYSGGRYPRLLADRASDAGVTERFHLLGRQNDIPRLMRAFDVFLQCSSAEAFGLVVIEAMASGVPVVAAAVDGVPEIIDHPTTGRLVHRDDVDGMAQAAMTLLTDRELASQVGRAARQVAVTKFSIDRTVEHVTDIYAELS